MSNIMTGSDLHAELCSWPVGADAEHSGLPSVKAMQTFPLIISQHRIQHDYDSVLVMGKVSLHKTRYRQCLMLLCYSAAITESSVTCLAQDAHTLRCV